MAESFAIRQSKTILARFYVRETEQAGLLTHIAATGSVWLCVPMKMLTAFVELEAATQAEQPIA